MGSLVTALAGWLEARSRGGRWLLRMDDLDEPRCPAGMDAVILRQLEAHGLTWDEAVRYQARHLPEYREALAKLRAMGLLYRCRCSRTRLAKTSRAGPDGPVYDGACRQAGVAEGPSSLRVRIGGDRLCLDDRWLARQCREPARDIGDFVVERADGRIAYQLASVIDEPAQGITDIVRGGDLLGSTFRQRCLQRLLGLAPPRYGHLPVVTDARGRKLSKQNRAAPVDPARAASNLVDALRRLGQAPAAGLAASSPAEVLHWARAHWRAATAGAGAQGAFTLAYNALQQSPSDPP